MKSSGGKNRKDAVDPKFAKSSRTLNRDHIQPDDKESPESSEFYFSEGFEPDGDSEDSLDDLAHEAVEEEIDTPSARKKAENNALEITKGKTQEKLLTKVKKPTKKSREVGKGNGDGKIER